MRQMVSGAADAGDFGAERVTLRPHGGLDLLQAQGVTHRRLSKEVCNTAFKAGVDVAAQGDECQKKHRVLMRAEQQPHRYA